MAVRVVGNICQIDRDCRKHNTSEGDFAVVLAHVAKDSDNEVEMATLMMFDADKEDNAIELASWLKDHTEPPESPEEKREFSDLMSAARIELSNLTGNMMRSIHTNYISDLLGRKPKSRAPSPRDADEDDDEVIHIAQQLVGKSFEAMLTICERDEQFFESHAVTVYAAVDQPTKVVLRFNRRGVDRSLTMRADHAADLLPRRFHFAQAPYLEPFTLEVLKLMPESFDADGENTICCEEAVMLMKLIGFSTGSVGTNLRSHVPARVAGTCRIRVKRCASSVASQV